MLRNLATEISYIVLLLLLMSFDRVWGIPILFLTLAGLYFRSNLDAWPKLALSIVMGLALSSLYNIALWWGVLAIWLVPIIWRRTSFIPSRSVRVVLPPLVVALSLVWWLGWPSIGVQFYAAVSVLIVGVSAQTFLLFDQWWSEQWKKSERLQWQDDDIKA
jgi:hypothetical protein